MILAFFFIPPFWVFIFFTYRFVHNIFFLNALFKNLFPRFFKYMSIINSWVPILTILFHQITRCQSSVQIYLEFFIYKKAIPKHFFLSKIKTMICFLFIYILFLHASHFDWSMSRICQNHYYNDRDSYIFRKISAKICKTYIHKQTY